MDIKENIYTKAKNTFGAKEDHYNEKKNSSVSR